MSISGTKEWSPNSRNCCSGYKIKEIQHQEFGKCPTRVFAIKLLKDS